MIGETQNMSMRSIIISKDLMKISEHGHNVLVDSSSTPDSVVCDCKQRKTTLDLKPASSNPFPVARWVTLPVVYARISAVVPHLFVRANKIILRSSRGGVLLDGPVPCLLAILLY